MDTNPPLFYHKESLTHFFGHYPYTRFGDRIGYAPLITQCSTLMGRMAIIEKRKPDFVQCTKSGFLVKRADAVPHSTRDGAKAAVGSIEEAEEPKRNLVVAASHLGVVAGEDDVGVALDALAAIADVDLDIAVDAV